MKIKIQGWNVRKENQIRESTRNEIIQSTEINDIMKRKIEISNFKLN